MHCGGFQQSDLPFLQAPCVASLEAPYVNDPARLRPLTSRQRWQPIGSSNHDLRIGKVSVGYGVATSDQAYQSTQHQAALPCPPRATSAHQIGWMRTFHARSETYRAAQACITDAHTRHPHSRFWGNGTTASSDGQFFRASDRAAKRGDVNLHYGSEPGSKFYSHLSDQYGYFSILPISPTESEAAYVLGGLFDQDTILDIQEHFTDTGGASDHVFGLFALIGKRFAPRLRNLKDRKFRTFSEAMSAPFGDATRG